MRLYRALVWLRRLTRPLRVAWKRLESLPYHVARAIARARKERYRRRQRIAQERAMARFRKIVENWRGRSLYAGQAFQDSGQAVERDVAGADLRRGNAGSVDPQP